MHNLHLPSGEPTPLADQYEAAEAHARRLAPDNRTLVEDGWVEDVLRHMTAPESQETPEPVVMVVTNADHGESARRPPVDGGAVTRTLSAQCSRCDWYEVLRVPRWYSTLWIAKGTTIVELVVCHLCALDLKRAYPEIVFKSGHDAVQR